MARALELRVCGNDPKHAAAGFVELARAGQVINNSTFRPFVIFVLVAALYFSICYPLSVLSRRLERGLNAAHR